MWSRRWASQGGPVKENGLALVAVKCGRVTLVLVEYFLSPPGDLIRSERSYTLNIVPFILLYRYDDMDLQTDSPS